MTQEEKELLFKDLCSRLPYEVQCEIGGLLHGPYTFTGNDVEDLIAGRMFKPYLRPMSSMTEEEQQEYYDLTHQEKDDVWAKCLFDKMVDFCNERHLDFRGLIPMGLALEATEGMYRKEDKL